MASTMAASLTSLFLLFFVVFVNSAATMTEEQTQKLTQSINQFSTQFYKESAAANPGKNLIMSPLSAEIALAMLSLGAREGTLEEMNKALYLPNLDFTKATFKPTIEKLNNVEGVTLKIANKVFVKDGPTFVLNDDFKAHSINVFQSEAQNVDFVKSEQAAKTINSWVEDKTNNKIKDLIKKDSLNDYTRMVLVNAIYFKGDWEKKFNPQLTTKRDFHLNENDKIQVDMMEQKGKFKYADLPEWDAKAIELPYVNKSMSMVIILPNKVDGLAAVENKLANGGNLNEVMEKMTEREVNLALPKFKIETTLDLKKILPKMGFSSIFTAGKANLKGLLRSEEDLYVSEAIQKAFIEVNEEGAEAAAATGMIMMCRMLPMTLEFHANHPFFFAIIAKSFVLFSGKVQSKLN